MTDSELLELPIFMGMTVAELSAWKAEGLFSVKMVPRGMVIVEENVRCDSLMVVVKGNAVSVTCADDRSYEMEENLTAPVVVQPERLFGLVQRYSSTLTAGTACTMVVIQKQAVLQMMERSIVFRINMLNMITTVTQRVSRSHWHQQSGDIAHRIIRFVKDHSLYPAGKKVLRIKMTILARELGCSRLEVSESLHLLEDRELLRMRRSAIEMPMLDLLLRYE